MTAETRALLREIVLAGGVMRPTAEQRVAVVQLLTAQAVVDVGRGFVAVPEMDADTLLMARGLMLDLELNPDIGVPDGVPGWAGLLEPETRRVEVYAAARDWLSELGLVRKSGGLLHDNTSDELRAADRPRFVPDGWDAAARWEPVPVPTALVQSPASAPAPLPTPSGMAHGDRPVELEPTAPKPRVVEKVVVKQAPAAPKPAPVVKPVEKLVAAPTPPKPAPVPSRAEHYLARIADALERDNYLTAETAGRVGLGADVQYSADAARNALAQHIAVLIGAEGSITRSELTANKLSKAQRDTARAALDFGVGVGGLKLVNRRYRLSDPTKLGWTAQAFREAVDEQKARRAQRESQRVAEAANTATKAALDRVLAR